MSSYTLVNVTCTFFSSIIIILIRTQITHTEQKQNFLQKQKKNKKKYKKNTKKTKKKQTTFFSPILSLFGTIE